MKKSLVMSIAILLCFPALVGALWPDNGSVEGVLIRTRWSDTVILSGHHILGFIHGIDTDIVSRKNVIVNYQSPIGEYSRYWKRAHPVELDRLDAITTILFRFGRAKQIDDFANYFVGLTFSEQKNHIPMFLHTVITAENDINVCNFSILLIREDSDSSGRASGVIDLPCKKNPPISFNEDIVIENQSVESDATQKLSKNLFKLSSEYFLDFQSSFQMEIFPIYTDYSNGTAVAHVGSSISIDYSHEDKTFDIQDRHRFHSAPEPAPGRTP